MQTSSTLRRRPGLVRALACAVLLFIGTGQAQAQVAETLALKGVMSDDGHQLDLTWNPARGAKVSVFRRQLGETGPESWRPLDAESLGAFQMSDTTLIPGTAYEYQVRLDRPGRLQPEPPRIGYWVAGTQVPAVADQGVALMIVDETLADPLAGSLDQFESDLIGAGYRVRRYLSPRGDDADAEANLRLAADLRGWIKGEFQADPARPHAAILIGHLPVVHTGWVRPDGHDLHAVPSDLYYADTTGIWPVVPSPAGVPQLLPSHLPKPIDMEIGRIDFAHLAPEFGTETDLLRAYLDRNHRWRWGKIGDPRSAYAATDHLLVETNALGNIVGPDAVRAAGHADSAGGGPYLLGIDFGDWNGANYVNLPPSEAAFTLNFGSGKHKFDDNNNPMTALLARPSNTVAVGWGARPAWQLQVMALGGSIGLAHQRTVNNGTNAGGMPSRDYLTTGNYDWVAAPWMNLLGDPTLRPFPLTAVTGARTEVAQDGVRLSWNGGADALVFRSDQRDGPWQRLEPATTPAPSPVIDPNPAAYYMIRATDLAHVNAGSFYRLAQGVIVEAP